MALISGSLYFNNSYTKIVSWLSRDSNRSDDFSRLLFTLVGVLAICLYAWICVKSKKGKPPSPPGPRGLPLVGNFPFLDPELHSYFAELARAYGPVVKLQLGCKVGILVASPSTAKEVLKDQDLTFANRDVTVASVLVTGGRDIAWNPYGPEWRMLRKVCVLKMLSNATLDKVYMLRRREVQQTVGYINSKSGSPVNVGEQIFLTILNVITNMLWGGSVVGDARATLAAEFRHAISEVTEILGLPNISNFFPVLSRLDLQGIAKRTITIPACNYERVLASPPSSTSASRPTQASTVGGYAIPKGSRVFINAWAIHRDPSIWENPLEFNPDRFLNSKWDFSRSDFRYFPFGFGRRICAGIAMAERMVMYLTATLLHSFDWEVPGNKKLYLSEKFGIVLKLKNPLVAIPTPRLSNPALYESGFRLIGTFFILPCNLY
ncbi:hypothetical protein PTKIN_Ptkin04bG0202100 [Pterospermum kingtungense]